MGYNKGTRMTVTAITPVKISLTRMGKDVRNLPMVY